MGAGAVPCQAERGRQCSSDGKGEAGGSGCLCPRIPVAAQAARAAALVARGGEGRGETACAWLGAAPRASAGTCSLGTHRSPTSQGQAPRLPLSCWTSVVPSPCPGSSSPRSRGLWVLHVASVMCQPQAGPGAQDHSVGAGSTPGSGTVPGAQCYPFTQPFPGGDLPSPPQRCPWSGQDSRLPVPPGLESTHGDSQ